MKVEDLIAQLQRLDPEREVYVWGKDERGKETLCAPHIRHNHVLGNPTRLVAVLEEER
jgi:hypothetical protein